MKATLRCTAPALALALAAVLAAAPAVAQQGPPPPACTAAEFRQFDFWVGDWVVENAQGQVMGSNRIDRVLDGCALHENWVGSRGGSGNSYNGWDPPTRRWYQTWVSSGGGVLRLEGNLEGAAMVMSGPGQGPGGAAIINRVTWTPLPDGRVRQHWETSADNGRTWTTAFDGLYRRRP